MYRKVLNRAQQRFYGKVLEHCALRMSGLLVVLVNEHPVCDFGYCRYVWLPEEREAFIKSGVVPLTTDDLRGNTPVLAINVYTRS